jgi:dihydroneopterin aldolase
MRSPKSIHRVALSAREALLFEAGIKLGGVFHQYIGIPVSPRTAPALARAIEAAVRLQPYVRTARVRIDPSAGGPLGTGRFHYRYLTGEMLDVTVELRDGTAEVRTRLRHRPELRYSLMSVERALPSHVPNRAARSARMAGRRRRRTSPSAG